jgi:hypothetical protein
MSTDERRLLELLAGSADGSTGALLAAHGFDFDLVACLVAHEPVRPSLCPLTREAEWLIKGTT